MIKNMFYTFSLDKQNIIKYGLGLKNNVFTLNIPIENTTDTIPLKIEVNNINEFKIKNIFVSNVNNDKNQLLQLRNKTKTIFHGG